MKLGLETAHSVCILGNNSPQWAIASIAAMVSGGLSVALYPNCTAATLKYIAENCRANIIMVDSEEQFAKLRQVDIKSIIAQSHNSLTVAGSRQPT